jgi:prepilin peptidase CpaA
VITLPLYLFILIELILVSIGDIKTRKIPNLWVILNLIISLILFVLFPQIYEFRYEAFQFPIVFIIVGFVLFRLRIMGGGDSKYLASFFLLIPYKSQDEVFLYLLISTVVIGSLFFFANLFRNIDGIIQSFKESNLYGVKKYFGTKFAFAPVILVTWILVGWELRESFLKIIAN